MEEGIEQQSCLPSLLLKTKMALVGSFFRLFPEPLLRLILPAQLQLEPPNSVVALRAM